MSERMLAGDPEGKEEYERLYAIARVTPPNLRGSSSSSEEGENEYANMDIVTLNVQLAAAKERLRAAKREYNKIYSAACTKMWNEASKFGSNLTLEERLARR